VSVLSDRDIRSVLASGEVDSLSSTTANGYREHDESRRG
jgi:hypothetical protein